MGAYDTLGDNWASFRALEFFPFFFENEFNEWKTPIFCGQVRETLKRKGIAPAPRGARRRASRT
jgi:hypothetical protein